MRSAETWRDACPHTVECDNEEACSREVPIVARCKCGVAYTAVDWQALPRVGLQGSIHGARDPEDRVLELRNCACGSTLARDVTEVFFGGAP